MIRIQASLARNRCLQTLEATGHAFRMKGGYSPVCAAVSAFLRTAGELLGGEKEVKVKVSAPKEGSLTIHVGEVPPHKVCRIQGITDFLLFGIQRLVEDAPDEVSFKFKEGE